MDVKYGKGCYQPTLEYAEKVANSLVNVANSMGIKTTAVLSKMDDPLVLCIGNNLLLINKQIKFFRTIKDFRACLRRKQVEQNSGKIRIVREIVLNHASSLKKTLDLVMLMTFMLPGNALEVAESVKCLKGDGPADLEELVIKQGALLLVNSGTENYSLNSHNSDQHKLLSVCLPSGGKIYLLGKLIFQFLFCGVTHR